MKVKNAAVSALALGSVATRGLFGAQAAPLVVQKPFFAAKDVAAPEAPGLALPPAWCPPSSSTRASGARLPRLRLGTPALGPGVVAPIDLKMPLTPEEAARFTSGFADYPTGQEAFYELVAEPRPLPGDLSGPSFLLSGNNHSDDLFMFLARELGAREGVTPGVEYDVEMTVRFASNQPLDSFGVGGSPGASVWMKGGVVDRAPRAVADGGGSHFSLEKGNQSVHGRDAWAFGPYGKDGSDDASWQLQIRTARSEAPVRATDDGKLWLYFGCDSGVEATTSVYVASVDVTLTPRAGGSAVERG